MVERPVAHLIATRGSRMLVCQCLTRGGRVTSASCHAARCSVNCSSSRRVRPPRGRGTGLCRVAAFHRSACVDGNADVVMQPFELVAVSRTAAVVPRDENALVDGALGRAPLAQVEARERQRTKRRALGGFEDTAATAGKFQEGPRVDALPRIRDGSRQISGCVNEVMPQRSKDRALDDLDCGLDLRPVARTADARA